MEITVHKGTMVKVSNQLFYSVFRNFVDPYFAEPMIREKQSEKVPLFARQFRAAACDIVTIKQLFRGGGGEQPGFFARLVSETAVDQQTRIRDQYCEGSWTPPTHRYLWYSRAHIWSVFGPITQLCQIA